MKRIPAAFLRTILMLPTAKKTPAKPKTVFAVRIAVAVIAVTLIVLGIANGGMCDVFVKAKKICMECVGLG